MCCTLVACPLCVHITSEMFKTLTRETKTFIINQSRLCSLMAENCSEHLGENCANTYPNCSNHNTFLLWIPVQINQNVKRKTQRPQGVHSLSDAKQVRFDLLVRRVLLRCRWEMRRANQKVQSWGGRDRRCSVCCNYRARTWWRIMRRTFGIIEWICTTSDSAHIFSAAPNVKNYSRRHRRRNVYFYQAPAKMPSMHARHIQIPKAHGDRSSHGWRALLSALIRAG